MSELDGIGEAVTGSVLGAAAEPATGAVGADGHSQERACLNCGTPLIGDYCHACGQRGHVHRTLSAFFHDLAHGILHLEGKVWRTLPMLAWRPGALTRRYIEGQRARFVSPIALFLFSVFLMFAVVSTFGAPANFNTDGIETGLKADVAEADARIRQLEAERQRIVAAKGDSATVDQRLKDAREAAELEKVIATGGARAAAVRVSDDVPAWLAEPVRRAAENPDLLLYKAQNNGYKYSWLLIPLSVPFLWLLFPFSRRFRLYDHMVFVTYSIAFMTLLVASATLAHAAGFSIAVAILFLIPPFHMYRQLRGAYDLGRAGALVRTILLMLFAVLIVALFVVALFATGIF